MNIQRRSFLQSVAAAFACAVTGVPVVPRQAQAINWDLFTALPEYMTRNYDLQRPWSFERLTVASDARVLLTVAGESDGDGTARVPDLSHLPWGEFDSGGWQPMGERKFISVSPMDTGMCDACGGTRWVDLHAVRHVPMTDPAYWEEDLCYSGGTRCARCAGDDLHIREVVGGVEFCPAYQTRIRTLGPLDWRMSEFTHGNIMLFRSDVVRGFVMPMTPRK